MADMAGCGGGAYGRRSWIPVPKSDDPLWVDRQRDRGSKTSGAAISAGRSGRVMARNKSLNAGGCGGCKLSDAAEEANKLANTVALVLPIVVVLPPELPERAILIGGSPNCGGRFSGESMADKEGKRVETKREH